MVTPITLNALEQRIILLIKVYYNRVPQNSSVNCASQCINMLSPFIYTIEKKQSVVVCNALLGKITLSPLGEVLLGLATYLPL